MCAFYPATIQELNMFKKVWSCFSRPYFFLRFADNICGDIMIITIFRTLIMYVFLTLGIRIMGKRQIGDMQPNELVVTLLISEIAAIPLQDNGQPLLNGVVAILVLVSVEILLSVVAMKSFFCRRLLSGQSIMLIKNGVLDQRAMKRVRMTVLDLIELLREQNVFDISTVSFAVLEVNGDMSIFLKPSKQAVTAEDLKITKDKEGLQLPVISDGKYIEESLTSLDFTKEEIDKILASKHTTYNNVFLMTIDRYKNMNIINKEV